MEEFPKPFSKFIPPQPSLVGSNTSFSPELIFRTPFLSQRYSAKNYWTKSTRIPCLPRGGASPPSWLLSVWSISAFGWLKTFEESAFCSAKFCYSRLSLPAFGSATAWNRTSTVVNWRRLALSGLGLEFQLDGRASCARRNFWGALFWE